MALSTTKVVRLTFKTAELTIGAEYNLSGGQK
ncbi:hypothetical protein Desor_2331 [Desulfosporosinus orientis DSM 765]|uniref:Uncharacterized protein n=1 Tax=Desulfosporosinus orientis (strain ATCC 19365 / DSM 765 / NCIMB 8382 / VKM B-1628 / Singapore I) TaxID=768706 RepID=G7WDF3_DESOD|nr:hypothetical protein Desor_2331 [Desulfosporosinus orientis DSM 765]